MGEGEGEGKGEGEGAGTRASDREMVMERDREGGIAREKGAGYTVALHRASRRGVHLVNDFGFRVWSPGFEFWVRVSGSGFRVSSFKSRVLVFRVKG